MDKKNNDNRSYKEIKAGWEKNGLVFGRLMSEDEKRQAQKYIDEKDAKIKRKEEKQIEKEMRNKPDILVSLAGVFSKMFHIIVTVYTMAIVVNALFIWQIYKVVSAVGWQGILQTKYTLYVVLYFVLLFILKKVYYYLYKYANT